MPRSLVLLLLLFSTCLANAQSTLTGLVTDPTGALVPGATLTLHLHGQPAVSARSNELGVYSLTTPAGSGTLDVSAPGFAPYLNPKLAVSGNAMTLNIQLIIATQTQEIEVSADTNSAADPNNNGDQITLKGHALDQLPTDQTQLQQQLNALSGGDAPELYINGFSGGTLPPKDTIREIRINQNPYSAQNDTNPVNGRIEIFTKPGADKLHGDLYVEGNDSPFNSRNPFAPNLPPYYDYQSFGSLGGPINKRASFFFSGGRRSYQGSTIVDAQIVDPVSLAQVPLLRTCWRRTRTRRCRRGWMHRWASRAR